MVSKLRRVVRGSWAKSVQKESWRVRYQMMGERSGRVKFCSESKLCGRGGRGRPCYNDIPTGLREKYRKAVAARTGEWSTGSSTSSGEEERKNKSLEVENKELRARLEALEKEGEAVPRGARAFHQGERESGLEEEWSMELDLEDEVESRKKLDETKEESSRRKLRDI